MAICFLNEGVARLKKTNCGGWIRRMFIQPARSLQMSKHINPLEKEFLIHQYKNNTLIKMNDFCDANHISVTSFRKWLKQYEEGGLEGLVRTDAELKEVLPEGIDRTEEAYKREIIKLRIENERLKKNYTTRTNEAGEQEYVRLKPKNLP